MTATNIILDNIKDSALDEFASSSHIGFGTDNTTPSESDTTLGAEVIRKAFDEAAIKNLGNGTYDFSATLGLTEGNGSTLQEVGLFDAAASGNMFIRNLLTQSVAKTTSIELSVSLRATISVVNQ